MVDFSEEDRRKLGELLEPMSKLPGAAIVDRRGEPDWMKPPYLGSIEGDLPATADYYLRAEHLRRTQPPSRLAIEAGINDIPEPPPLMLEELIRFLTPNTRMGPR